MAKNILTSVIITALIVAVIASLATVALTGSVIKLIPYKGIEFYTKTEIDNKIDKLSKPITCANFNPGLFDVENNTGYEFCAEKGYNKFCLISREKQEHIFSGANCTNHKYITKSSSLLNCNKIIQNYVISDCIAMAPAKWNESLVEEVLDNIICCK